MDKPTCATCPYWASGSHGFADGSCRRRAPSGPIDTMRDYIFAPMNSTEWCGEHPDFPAWIEETRKPAEASGAGAIMAMRNRARIHKKALDDWMDCNGIPRKASARSLMRALADLYEQGLDMPRMLQSRRVRQKKAYIGHAEDFLRAWKYRTQEVAGYVRREGGPSPRTGG